MTLTREQVAELDSVVTDGYDRSVSARARMVLLADRGMSPASVAAELGTTSVTVRKWLKRWREGGLAELEDHHSTGRPREVSGSNRARILALTGTSPPDELGISHWSSYAMADYLARHENIRVSHNFVSVLWRENGLTPHRIGTHKLSRDPDFAVKVIDICGLYIDPPAGAVVLSVDELCDASHNSSTHSTTAFSGGLW